MPIATTTRRALLAGLGASIASHASAGIVAPPASAWADLELLDGQDRRFRLGDTEKPFTLIRLWANWCAVCMAELGAMPSVATALAASGVQTILVSNPPDWSRDHQIARDHGITLRCARPSPANRAAVVRADLMAEDGWFYVPRTVLFSHARQEVLWSHVGGLPWNADTLASITRHLPKA